MKYVVMCSRWVVGLLFIFSGWVKLNDPVGFSFKLEEYFSPSVLDIPWLVPGALALALVLVVFEVLLGVALLIGFAPKWTLYSLTGMIVFFTFLTFYSAYFNKVTDCGCFGDAIPLTPWQSFYKDVVLVVLIGFLWLGQSKLGTLSTHKTRIILMLFQNLKEITVCQEHLSDIDALNLIIKLQNRHWVDDDINKMLESLFEYFDQNQKVFSSIEKFKNQVVRRQLRWGPCHTEKFWQENCILFDK